MAITGASLTNIYNRLHAVDEYHPMTAETFADWSIEAGDIVTVSREDVEYASPVNSTRMVWKGAPQITLNSTGNKERDAVSKVSRRKYGRSGASINNGEEIHKAIYSDDGYLHAYVDITASAIRTEVGETISGMAQSIIEQTATYIRTEVQNAASSIAESVIEQTSEYVRTEVTAVASGVAWSVVEQTMTDIFQEVARKSSVYVQWTDPNDGTRTIYNGDVWVKSYDLRTWNDLSNKTWNELSSMKWNTFYSDWVYVWKNGAWHKKLSTDVITESSVKVDQDSEKWAVTARQVSLLGEEYRGNLTVTAQQIKTEMSQSDADLHSQIVQTAGAIRSEVSAANSTLYSTIEQTATYILHEVVDENVGNFTTIMQTSTMISISATATKSELRGEIKVQADRISLVVSGTGDQAEVDAASIVVGINKQTGSYTKIKAQTINLEGYVQATQIDADYINAKYNSSNWMEVYNLRVLASMTYQYTTQGGGGSVGFGSLIKDLQITGPTNNVYTLQKKIASSDTWADVGTFSRATSLSGAWGSGEDAGYFVVTASPQGNKYRYNPPMRLNGNGSTSFSAEVTDTGSGGIVIAKKSIYGYLILNSNTTASTVTVNTKSDGTGTNVGSISVGTLYSDGANAKQLDVQASWVKPDIHGSAPLHNGDWFNTRMYKNGTEVAHIATDGSTRGVKLHALTEITANTGDTPMFPDYENGYMGFYGVKVNVPNAYPQTKTMKCTGSTFTQSEWHYTFEYVNSTSGMFTTGQNYKFHNNTGYT